MAERLSERVCSQFSRSAYCTAVTVTLCDMRSQGKIEAKRALATR